MTSLARIALVLFAFISAAPVSWFQAHASITTVSPSVPTGFDITLDSAASGYNLSTGSRLWWGFQPGGFVEFTVSANAGTYALQLYYSTTQAGPLGVSVNGVAQPQTYLPSSGSWGSFQMSPQTRLTLPAGRSVLRLSALPQFTPFNLAGMLLSPIAIAPPAPVRPTPPPVQPAPPAPVTPPSAPAPPVTTTKIGTYPLNGSKFYVSPYSESAQNIGLSCGAQYPNAPRLISKLAEQAQGIWFGDWNSNPGHDVSGVVAAASLEQAVPILITYNIPIRDCGGYSGGGASSAAGYQSWISSFASGIGDKKVVVILEPDALSQLNNQGCLNSNERSERVNLLKYAVNTLHEKAPQSVVYLDAGHNPENGNGITASDMAGRLSEAGVAGAAGFALNVSNYETTGDNAAYGQQISKLIGNKHFVIDTSRNGRGPDANHDWCNPANRGAGSPSQGFNSGLIDGYVWAQNPGSSDGSCNGAPSAGTFSTPIACTLAANANF